MYFLLRKLNKPLSKKPLVSIHKTKNQTNALLFSTLTTILIYAIFSNPAITKKTPTRVKNIAKITTDVGVKAMKGARPIWSMRPGDTNLMRYPADQSWAL